MSADCHVCPNRDTEEAFKKLWALKDITQQSSGLWRIRIMLRHGRRLPAAVYSINACQECAVKWYGMEVLFAQLKASGNSLPQ